MSRLHRITLIRTVYLRAEVLIEAVDSDDATGQIEHQIEMAWQGGVAPSIEAVNWGEIARGRLSDPMFGEYEVAEVEPITEEKP